MIFFKQELPTCIFSIGMCLTRPLTTVRGFSSPTSTKNNSIGNEFTHHELTQSDVAPFTNSWHDLTVVQAEMCQISSWFPIVIYLLSSKYSASASGCFWTLTIFPILKSSREASTFSSETHKIEVFLYHRCPNVQLYYIIGGGSQQRTAAS